MPTAQISRPAPSSDAGVGGHRAEPRHGALAHEAEGQPALDQEQEGRAEPEHHQGMAIEPIAEAAAPIAGEIFAHRQRLDVADAAPVEIARCRVMDRMAAPPVIVGRHCQDADRAADPVVGDLAGKERAVPAIVLDHEQANEQPGGERRQRERKPELAMTRGDEHRGPDGDKRREGDGELKDAARRARPAVRDERLRPVARRPRCAIRFRRRHSATPARHALLRKASSSGWSTAPREGSPAAILAATRLKGRAPVSAVLSPRR